MRLWLIFDSRVLTGNMSAAPDSMCRHRQAHRAADRAERCLQAGSTMHEGTLTPLLSSSISMTGSGGSSSSCTAC